MRHSNALTRQQAHILREFGNPDDPYEQSSDTLAICGVREWPTCDNLIAAGLIERTAWIDGEGWLYRLTSDGCEQLRLMRAEAC